jgi:hypothetical protein
MPRVLVVHPGARRGGQAAQAVCQHLCGEGFEAEPYPVFGASGLRLIRGNPPAAILIDLTELPSYGRAMGALLREQKGTRAIPLVFLEGDPEKAARVREMLPDAEFAPWARIGAAVSRAIRRPPAYPLAPDNSRTSLCEKLRIRAGTTLALVRSPAGIRKALAPVPAAVHFRSEIGEADVVLVFVRSAAALSCELPALARAARPRRTLWICWPKRTSGVTSDLSPDAIRALASPYGLVDNKICSIDQTWSGTALAKARTARRGSGIMDM